MWYNESTNVLQVSPPWGSDIPSENLRLTKYGDWKEKQSDFSSPNRPSEAYEWDEGEKAFKLNKSKAVSYLNSKYAERIAYLDRAMAIINADASRTAEQKNAELTNISTQYATLRSELKTKQEAILNA